MNTALIIAGGTGQRMGQDIPKQFLHVNDKPVIIYTLEAFQKHPEIDEIEVVCLEGWHEVLKAYAKQFSITKLVSVVNGGLNGQDSIRNGVMDIASRHSADNDIVVIHDSIRPMVSLDVITDNLRVCKKYGNATTVVPCNTAMLKSKDALLSTSQLSRDQVKMTQTPQSFHLKEFVSVHKEALEKGITASVASCTLYIELGREVYLSKGSEKNLKLTTTDDVDIFKALLTTKKESWLR